MTRVLGNKIPYPWMLYEEIEIIEELLRLIRPKHCLEWGAGFSTLYYPKCLEGGAVWQTVEHDNEWCNQVTAMNKNTNTSIIHVEPNKIPSNDVDEGDGSYLDMHDYIEFPDSSREYDFILIDGRARKACLVKAYELLAEDGVVVLHDAQRPYYRESFPLYQSQVMLSGYSYDTGNSEFARKGHGQAGLWIGSKGLKMENLINIPRLQRLWSLYGELSKIRIFKRHLLFYANISETASGRDTIG